MVKKTKISFCIPCYRSEHTITKVIDEIIQIVQTKKEHFEFEIVCAVDGSPDNVYSVLKLMAVSKPFLKIINFSKNYGQANARMATFKYASGDYCVCLDDDGQCPIDHLWELIEPLENNADVAICRYYKKSQTFFRRYASSANNYIMHLLLDLPKEFKMSNFFALRSNIVLQILKYRNPYPYLTGLIVQSTNNFVYVDLEERYRFEGTSGYNLKKLLTLWLNGVTNFSVRPLRIADLVGFFCSFLGFVIGLQAIIKKIFFDDINIGYTSIFSAIFFVGGIIMVLLGIIGEYIGRIFICINNAPQYVIKDTVNIDIDNKNNS